MPCAPWGASVERDGAGIWRVQGRGVGGLVEPGAVLYMGNSGTGARLLMGLLASHPFTSFLAGDASLSARPMERVMAPLKRMGAGFITRSGGRLPIAIVGAEAPVPISYEVPVASAQVKSAVLLAGLNAPGTTRVVELRATRDHTESMLRHFGAEIDIETRAEGGRTITLTGEPEITGRGVDVPGDISSAAFPLVAALLVPDSHITLKGIGGQSPAHRPPRHASRNGCRHRFRQPARFGRGAGGRSHRHRLRPQGRRRARRARPLDDRRVPGAGGGRGAGRRHHAHARYRRAAGQGKRPPERFGAGPPGMRRRRGGRRRFFEHPRLR